MAEFQLQVWNRIFLGSDSAQPIPEAARSKAYSGGRSVAGIARSNSSEGVDICVVCVVKYRKGNKQEQ
jgi:hypothetical protein